MTSWEKPVVRLHPTKKIVGFWHIGVIGDWSRIAGEQYAKLRACGLRDACERIVVGFVGGKGHSRALPLPILDDPKFDIFVTDNPGDFEYPTLARLSQEALARAEPFLCFYFHTKGASRSNPATNAWRLYMEHFNLERWRDCVNALTEHETCGVELDDIHTHYGGNFWWATSEYIRKLQNGYAYWQAHRDDRMAAELYVCSAHPKAYCFSDFPENLYEYEVPESRYRR